MMPLEAIEKELNDMVSTLGLKDAEVEAEISGRWIHILISTPSFEGKTAGERENVIWREFEKRFDDETILFITQCYLLTPEERATTVGLRDESD